MIDTERAAVYNKGVKLLRRRHMSAVNFKTAVKEAAKRIGIDLIGFASKSRFEGVDPQHNPFSIFPEGKTVIMVTHYPEELPTCITHHKRL